MEIKKGLDVSTEDFWYDITDGGYLKPSEICLNEKDVIAVNTAIDILNDFRQSCEDQIEGFIR